MAVLEVAMIISNIGNDNHCFGCRRRSTSSSRSRNRSSGSRKVPVLVALGEIQTHEIGIEMDISVKTRKVPESATTKSNPHNSRKPVDSRG